MLKHGRKAKSFVKYGLEEIFTILVRPTYTPNLMFSNFCHLLKRMIKLFYLSGLLSIGHRLLNGQHWHRHL